MANEEVLDALVSVAPTLQVPYDLEKWSAALCTSYEANPSDFSAFAQALKDGELDAQDVDAVEEVLREQGEMSAVEELCRDGSDALHQELLYAADRYAEQPGQYEAAAQGEAAATAEYNRDEAFPWIAGWVNTIIGDWDGTPESWPAFRRQVTELIAQQSGGRADMAAAVDGLFTELDGAGADRFAALARYGITATRPDVAAPADPQAAAYDRDAIFPWVIGLANSLVGTWDGTEATWPDFRAAVTALVEAQAGGRADLLAAAAGFFAEVDAGGADRVATLQAFGIEAGYPAAAGSAPVESAPAAAQAAVADLVQNLADEVAQDDGMPDLADYDEEVLNQAMELVMDGLEARGALQAEELADDNAVPA